MVNKAKNHGISFSNNWVFLLILIEFFGSAENVNFSAMTNKNIFGSAEILGYSQGSSPKILIQVLEITTSWDEKIIKKVILGKLAVINKKLMRYAENGIICVKRRKYYVKKECHLSLLLANEKVNFYCLWNLHRNWWIKIINKLPLLSFK